VSSRARKPVDDAVWKDFASRLHYVSGKFEDPANFVKLGDKLAELDARNGTREKPHLLSRCPAERVPHRQTTTCPRPVSSTIPPTPPSIRASSSRAFGRDLASAAALTTDLHRVFNEGQIFRIDHYLGKETSRTWSRCASGTPSSSLCGTETTSTTCRSR